MNVIAIFDAGKTNKKLLLFDQDYNIVFERSVRFDEITDEDGDPCENIDALRASLFALLDEVLQRKKFVLKAINYTAYGASLVYLDEQGNVLTPLYNYLKKYPPALQQQLYAQYGGETEFSHVTASPVLGSLNSGLQLYRIKYEKPEIFKKIRYALHLPQYLSYLLTGKACSDITSIGSHTALWDFSKNDYHEWVEKEGMKNKLAPVLSHDEVFDCAYGNGKIISGIGLHDSSAALIPYLLGFTEPFVLISTGTWSITLNPFNETPLSTAELQHDCLCYLGFGGKPVKASRLFAGYEHDEQVKKLASHFQKPIHFYEQVNYDPAFVSGFLENAGDKTETCTILNQFKSYEKAYHHLMFRLVQKQVISSGLVMTSQVKRIFVDGGFSKNPLFMNILASLYPGKEVYAAAIAQSTALGAALSIHAAWNNNSLPQNMIDLKFYSSGPEIKPQ
jgi:sugar (pentulose or hexulose) kinase